MDTIAIELVQVFKSHRAFMTTKLAEIGLYPGQQGLIYNLAKDDGQTMSELVEKLKTQHTTLFKMVERMVKVGLLEKRKHETDKRASRIFLTPKGKAKLSQLEIMWKETEDLLSKGFLPNEKKVLCTLLKRLNNNLN